MNEPERRPARLPPATVEISRFWPPEVALAVFGLIDNLRDNILLLHGDHIRALLKGKRPSVDPAWCAGSQNGDAPPF